MSFLIRSAFRYAAQKVAADPRAREKATEYARAISDEVKNIAREDDRAYAAGRSVRRFLNGMQQREPRTERVINPQDALTQTPRLEHRDPDKDA